MTSSSTVGRLATIIVSFNTKHLLAKCLDTLRVAEIHAGLPSTAIVVDNASADGSADFLCANYPHIPLIRSDKNVGFGRANNLALKAIGEVEFVLLLNTDAFVSEDAISETLRFMDQHPRCGIVGVRLTDSAGGAQPSCRNFPSPVSTFVQRTGLRRLMPWVLPVDDARRDFSKSQECDWVPGCFYLIRRQVINSVGLFDPLYFLYFEEVDHCFATKSAGWTVNYCATTSTVHLGGESAGSQGKLTKSGNQLESLQMESAMLYYRKNFGIGRLFLHLILETIADAIISIKALLKGRSEDLAFFIRRIGATARIARATRLGTTPTR
jgi:N-acetylglucosaminyl-diphospho-decaprenol L-rhamnosyltransferase